MQELPAGWKKRKKEKQKKESKKRKKYKKAPLREVSGA